MVSRQEPRSASRTPRQPNYLPAVPPPGAPAAGGHACGGERVRRAARRNRRTEHHDLPCETGPPLNGSQRRGTPPPIRANRPRLNPICAFTDLAHEWPDTVSRASVDPKSAWLDNRRRFAAVRRVHKHLIDSPSAPLRRPDRPPESVTAMPSPSVCTASRRYADTMTYQGWKIGARRRPAHRFLRFTKQSHPAINHVRATSAAYR